MSKLDLCIICCHGLCSLTISVRDLVKLQREVMTTETAIEQKRLARHNLLLACKIQNLPISLLSGSLNEISEVQVGQRCLVSTLTYHSSPGLFIKFSSNDNLKGRF